MTVSARPTREELLAYAVGKLSDADSERVAAYVESDPDCQAMLATLDGTDDTLVGQLRLPEADDPFAAESQCDAALARAKGMTEPDAASAASLALGTLGEYRLLEKLGQGGMGTVYKALHTKLDRVVALKVIAKERMNDPQAVARFGREMKAIGQLDHPGIVAAFDAREIDGVPVLVMEYVDGMDLGRLVRRHGPIAVADACELVRRKALALLYAHEHGLVHRDVKPSNVMLTRSGDVKLLDLGLARGPETPSCGAGVSPAESHAGGTPAPQSHVGRSVLTNTGQAMGTADYMAPEQVAAPQTVDIRADIYSLGCTLFKLLSGRAPYDGTDCGGTLEKLAAHTDRPVPRIADMVDVPEALAAAVDRMLAKSPDDRPETPAAVAAALAPFSKGHDLVELLRRAEAQSSPQAAERATPQTLPAGRRWKLITTVIALMLFSFALGTACGVLITIRRGDQQTAVHVPDGARVDIGEDGNVNVTLPPDARSVRAGSTVGRAKADEHAVEAQTLAPPTAATLSPLRLKISGPAHGVVGDKVQFNFEVTNTGTKPLENLKVVDRYDAPLKAFLATPGYRIENEKLTWMLRSLPAGKSTRLDIHFRCLTTAAKARHQVTVTASNGIRAEAETYLEIRASGEKAEPATPAAPEAAPAKPEANPPAADAVANDDQQSLRGTWAVVSQSYGGGASYFIPRDVLPHQTATGQDYDDPAQATGDVARFVFTGDTFTLRGSGVWMTSGKYQINPGSEPKRIDIGKADRTNLLGIYKLEGDRLTLCLAEKDRPTDFWPEFGSQRVLLVLRRVGDVETHPDEKAILGDWHVVKITADRISDHYRVTERNSFGGEVGRETFAFSMWLSMTSGVVFDKSSLAFLRDPDVAPGIGGARLDERTSVSPPYAIDPTAKPATIDVSSRGALGLMYWSPPRPATCSIRGIYRLDGDVLTLRLALSHTTVDYAGAPRPVGFDTELGEDEFELVLSRKKPAEKPVVLVPADHLDFRLAPTRETMPQPPAFDLQKRPESGLAWFETRDGVGQNLVTAEHEGRRYVLLSTKADEVLLGGRYGPPDWKLSSVGLARDERGKPMLQLELDEAGGKRLAKLTGEHPDRQMAILVDDRVVTAPTIKSAIAAKVAITGNFEMAEVEAMQKALAAGIETPTKKEPGEGGKGTANERK
ncbi:MAG: protein kinase [Planctomycetia bacterium]|nr:protein kinase [Planctomycetia bacterium]